MSDAVPTFPPRLEPTGPATGTATDTVGAPVLDPTLDATPDTAPDLLDPVDPAAPVVAIPVEGGYSAPPGPRPVEAPAGVEISYEQFGRHYIRRVLNLPRILETIDALLGPTIELGPIGAGPGRAFASVSVLGRFAPTSGHEIPGDLLTYGIDLPIAVTFTLDLPMDSLTFNADVVVPLTLVVHTEAPTTIRMELTMPPADQVQLQISPSTRRGAVFQKITGLESELRRFLPQVLQTELAKPYIQKAMRLDMEELIEKSWDDLSGHFLPQGPEDRKV